MKWAVIGLVTVAVLAVALFFLLRWFDGKLRLASAKRTEAEITNERASVLAEKRKLSNEEALEEWKRNNSGGSP